MSVSWLLFKKSGRQSVGRLGLTVLAIGLGTLMLLSFLAGINGLTGRMQRMSWLNITANGGFETKNSRQAQTPIDGVAPLQISITSKIGNTSMWRDKRIQQTIFHATGENSPELPGLKTPGPGEYYLSPGLEKIAREHPEDKIGERYGTKYLGTIPARYVQSPDSMEVISGATDEQLAGWQQADENAPFKPVDIYNTDSLKHMIEIVIDPSTLIIFGMGGTILLFPIVMFVAVATQLGSAQREQRYAALRLIGATKNQINRILLFESFIATAVGIVLGSLAFLLVRGQLTHFKFGELGFWSEDLNVMWLQYIVLVALTLGLSLFASWRAMRKVRTSPLGVARRETLDKKPRFWRFLPLASGVGIFVWISTGGGSSWIKSQSADNMTPLLLVMAGIFLVMFGLVIAGSWLTSRLSQLFARHTNNATTLLASRRIAGHSRKIFRSVSGLVLALFAGSFYLAAVSGVDNLNIQSIQNNGYSQLKPQTAMVLSQSLPSDLIETLRQQSYIKSASAIYETKDGSLIPCRDLPTYTKHACPSGAGDNDLAMLDFVGKTVNSVSVIPEAELTKIETFPSYLVMLDDSASIDKLRSLAITQTPAVAQVYVADGTRAQKPVISPVVKDLAALTYVGIGITLFVAVASLVVSTIGGLLERRRSLFTLRLGGMTLGQMKRVVLIESLIPLIGTSVLAAGAGIWVAKIFLEVFSSTVRVSLSATYFAIVIGSLVLAVIGIWLVLPMLKKITSLEQNQTE